MHPRLHGGDRESFARGNLLLALPFDKLQTQNLCRGFRKLRESGDNLVADREVFEKFGACIR